MLIYTKTNIIQNKKHIYIAMYIKRMLEELEKKGVKKKDIPDKLDISYGSVLNYLSEKRVMPIDVFFEIIRIYELDVCSVLDCSEHTIPII